MSESNEDLNLIKAKVEAILFSYGDFIDFNAIKDLLRITSDELLIQALDEVSKKFETGYSFRVESEEFELQEHTGIIKVRKWKMALKEEFNDLITDFVSGFEMPKSALKVLSVIAYEQPVSKTRLSEILGKSVKEDVNYLYKAKFLTYEKNGIGKYYRVTKKFFDYFKMDENIDFRAEANKSMKVILEKIDSEEEIVNKNLKSLNTQIQEEED